MFIIENEAGEKVDQWKSGKNPVWPNGASMSGTATDGMVVAGHTAYEVAQVTEGEGPRKLGFRGPEKVDGKWQRVKLQGAALPPAPDPVPGDEGYDHATLRKAEFEKTLPMGDQADAILKWAVAIRMKQSTVATAIDNLSIDVAVDPDGVEADVITLNTDSLSALKSALTPIFDLPSDLDAIVGKWTAGKAKFPKPE